MNFSAYNLQLLFSLGVFAQLIFTVGGKFERKDLKKLFLDIGVALLAAVYAYLKSQGDLGATIITSAFILSVLFAITFREKVLPEINEIVLIVWNIGFWYLYLSRFGLWHYLSLILLVPTYLTLVVGIFKVNLNNLTKILLYLWFMIMGVSVSIMLLPLKEVIESTPIPPFSPAQSFFLGMMFFYSFSYLLYIFYFIPIPGKNETFYERLQNLKEHAALIASKFSDTQYRPIIMLLVVALVSIGMYLNSLYKFLDENLLLSISFGLSPFIGEKFGKILNAKSDQNQQLNQVS